MPGADEQMDVRSWVRPYRSEDGLAYAVVVEGVTVLLTDDRRTAFDWAEHMAQPGRAVTL